MKKIYLLDVDPAEKFAKILNSINILVIGWTISHLIPIAFNKTRQINSGKEDYEKWKDMTRVFR